MFWRKRKPSDFSAEVEAHLELEAQQLKQQGLSDEDARAAARRAFGNVTRAEERFYESGRWLGLDRFAKDLRFGLRMLAKNPGFTAVAVLTLAIGIGVNTAIFSLIDTIMLKTLPVQKPEELLQVQFRTPRRAGEPRNSFTNPLWEQLRDRQDAFSGIFAWGADRFDLAQGGAVNYAQGIRVSGEFFRVLGLRPAVGRLIAPSDDRRGCPGVAVLGYGFWQEHYDGAPSAIGSNLVLSAHSFEIVGVAPPGFYGIDVGSRFDVAIPICTAAMFDGEESRIDSRAWWWLHVVGRTKRGVSRAQLAARLKTVSSSAFTDAVPQNWSPEGQRDFESSTFVVVPAATGLSPLGLRQQFDQPLNVLMAVVGLVLLIACANIASLMLARAAVRQRELALRQALGASRFRLIRQLLTECIMLSSAGALLGILFARWGAILLVHYLSTARNVVFLDLSLDYRVLGFTAAVALLTGLLFGVLPAFRSTKLSLTSAMKVGAPLEGARRGRFRARQWIVSTQVALSLVLLVAAGLLLRSFAKLATLDIGFDRNNVLLVTTNLQAAKVPPELQFSTYEQIDGRLRAIPGVVSVARSVMTPIQGGVWDHTISTDWSKALNGEDALVRFNGVSPGYFATLTTPLLAGRDFTHGDTPSAPAVAIINQTLASRFFPAMNPIGKTFRVNQFSGQPGPPIEVVGLVRDSKYESVREDIQPTAFLPVTQTPGQLQGGSFELRTAIRPSALVSAVQSAVAGVNKEIPLEFHTLAEQVNDSLVQERLLAVLSGFFGALAMLLAMIGLYGTLSYLVAQRQQEFGIRMALGAESRSILRLVMRSVLSILAVGVLVGIGISLAATRTLQQLLFGLGPRDTVTMVAAVAVLSVVAIVAGYMPARRATKVDPMVALRYE
ncbi:MAG: ADOP family duplicated permease [Terriglobia bacterium]